MVAVFSLRATSTRVLRRLHAQEAGVEERGLHRRLARLVDAVVELLALRRA